MVSHVILWFWHHAKKVDKLSIVPYLTLPSLNLAHVALHSPGAKPQKKSIIKGDNLCVTGPYQTMLRFPMILRWSCRRGSIPEPVGIR